MVRSPLDGQRARVQIPITFHRLGAALGMGAIAVTIAFPAGAEPIHKCVGSGTTYQAQPCGDRETEVAVAASASRPSRIDDMARGDEAEHFATVAKARSVADRSARWLPYRRANVEIGMTDDEVLNTPDGGVPTFIGRSRGKATWREVWTYASRGGALRELTFTNGRLTAIDTGNAPAQSVRLATAGM